MAGLNIGLARNAVWTALDLVFDAEFDYPVMSGIATAESALVFNQSQSTKSGEIVEQFMGSGYWDTRAEQQDVPSGTNRVGNQKTFTHVNYAKAIDISKNFFDDDQHAVVQMMIKNFARNARLTRDKNAFDVYNLGFTSTTTNDAAYLFSASHTTLNNDTVSNLVSGALSDTTLETAIIALQEQMTQDGTLGGHEPGVLLVPPALFKEATIFTKSELRPTTANNDLNYVSTIWPGLVVYQTPFLGAANGGTGSDTAWYVLSKNHSMYRWIRQAVQTVLVDWKGQRNNNYIYKGEFRETIGPIAYEGMVGATGV